MKRFSVLFLACLILISMAACNTAREATDSPDATSIISGDAVSEEPADSANADAEDTADVPARKVLNVYCPSNQVYEIVKRYKELHPEFPYKIQLYSFATADTSFEAALDYYLATDGPDTPDIYCIESGRVKRYTMGEQSRYATPYRDLGIDLYRLVQEADIPQYVLDMGTNAEGQVVALSYQGTGSAFIYRRSIAKDVWGTDDPETIKDIIGPGWDKFLEAAADLKAKGYGIVSGIDDIWPAVKNSAEMPWVVGSKLVIDPRREAFLDLARQLVNNGYTNNIRSWHDEWYMDMQDDGPKKIFGFLGPSWLINYTIKPNCGGERIGEGTYGDWAVCEPPAGFFWGGFWVFVNQNSPLKDDLGDLIKWITLDSSETGFQYSWANGTFLSDQAHEAATSGTVMNKVSGALDFLGNQNMFPVLNKAARLANGKNVTEYDDIINVYWCDQVHEYAEGRKTREQAIADFKKSVKDNLEIAVE